MTPELGAPRARPGGTARVAVIAVLAGACSGAPPPPPRPAEPPAVKTPPALPDRDWGIVESARFFVRVPLPDRAAWSVDDASGRWLTALHVPSKSMLLVRAFHGDHLMSHAACEAEARPWRPDVLGKSADALVDRRPIDAPPGFDAEVGYSVRRSKDALGGVAVLAAARVRQCLVVAYVTRADGADAATALAGRLAFVTERIFGRLESRTVEDRAPARAPGPGL